MSGLDQRRATWLALMAVALWSTVATAFKLSLQYLSPAALLAWASLFSSAVLLGWLALRGRLRELIPEFRDTPWRYLGLGLLNPLVYYLVLFEAYDRLPAQQAQTINYTWAITLGLMSIVFLKRPYGWRDGLAALLGYAGVLVIATRGDLAGLAFDSPSGVALALLSTLIWAGYWILNTRMTVEPVLGLALCFLCSLPLTWLYAGYTGALWNGQWQALAGAAYVGLFEMGVTFVLWLAALRAAENIARVSNLIFLSPFLSLVLIHWVLGEALAAATFIGLGMILLGTFVQQYRRGSS